MAIALDVPCLIPSQVPYKNGYVGLSIGGRRGRRVYAHRLAWETTYGPIPDGLWVLHHCDNRACSEPTHLFLGTHADNMADMVAKGRWHRPTRTHCKHGHEFTPENTYEHLRDGRPRRDCRTCLRDAEARQRVRKSADHS